MYLKYFWLMLIRSKDSTRHRISWYWVGRGGGRKGGRKGGRRKGGREEGGRKGVTNGRERNINKEW